MSKGLKKAGKIIGGIEDWMVIVLFTAMVVVTMQSYYAVMYSKFSSCRAKKLPVI